VTARPVRLSNTALSGAVTRRLERLDNRSSDRCDRTVSHRVGPATGGSAVRTDVAVQHGAGDQSVVVLEGVRLVDAASLAVRTTQSARLLSGTDPISTADRRSSQSRWPLLPCWSRRRRRRLLTKQVYVE